MRVIIYEAMFPLLLYFAKTIMQVSHEGVISKGSKLNMIFRLLHTSSRAVKNIEYSL